MNIRALTQFVDSRQGRSGQSTAFPEAVYRRWSMFTRSGDSRSESDARSDAVDVGPAAGGERWRGDLGGSPSGWTFRSDVEGLRAVAILLVIAYHAHLPVARGGFIGVDVFFVLSGFLITGILAAEIRATGRVSLSRFWARRARRLLPAAALVVAATLLASALVMSPYEQVAYAKSALAFAAYASNLWFVRQETDYFAEAVSTDPLLHTWSLSIEEQFYLVYAPLIALLAWMLARRGAELVRSRLTIVIGALTALSLAGCLVLVRQSPVHAFYLLPARAWEFGAGALLALAPAHGPLRRIPIPGVLGWLALMGLVASGALIGQSTRHPGVATIVPVLCTVILIATGGVRTGVSRLLSLGPMRTIGRLSYSWYLWHWPPLVLLTAVFGALPPAYRLMVVVAALVPTALAYRLVEQPVRESRWLSARPGLSLAGGLALAVVVGVAAIGGWRNGQHTIESAGFAFVRDARAQPRIYADGCHAAAKSDDARMCTYGDPDGDTLLVLFGDSHAAQWFPALESVARARGWRLVPFTKTGCPSATVTVFDDARRVPYVACDRWREAVLATLQRERPTIVLMTNFNNYAVEVDGRVQRLRRDAEARRQWANGLRLTIAAVERSGARAILLHDTPYPGDDPLSCLARAYRAPERCAVVRTFAVDTAMVALERRIAREARSAAFISMTPYLCDAERCPVVRNGVAVFRDRSHLTVAFAKRLGSPLAAALSGVLPRSGTVPPPAELPRRERIALVPAASTPESPQPRRR